MPALTGQHSCKERALLHCTVLNRVGTASTMLCVCQTQVLLALRADVRKLASSLRCCCCC
jgi:hypothetical protein